MIKVVIFDFGNTLIEQVVDDKKPLNMFELKFLNGAKKVLEDLNKCYKLAILSKYLANTEGA